MHDLVIVGGGPAGAAAAIFTARAGLDTLVIDADKGVTRRALLNNHLGFPDGIPGPELIERGRRQAEAAGAAWVDGSVASLEGEKGGFVLTTEDGERHEAAEVLLAIGTTAKLAEASGITTRDGTEPRIRTIVDVDPDGRTDRDGVWAAGTVAGVSVHTMVTSGDGARVALNVISARNGERHVDHDVLPAPDAD